MDNVNITVIGAGVVGLAVAARLSKDTPAIYVLEKNNSFGQETSSRNSEVIHAGIYYPPDSLKAKLCVSGNQLLYKICAKYGIPHKKIGKFIVATSEKEEAKLQKLLIKSRNNGVKGTKFVSRKELNKFAPNVKGRCALYSPNTGIIDTHSLMKFFEQQIKNNKGEIAYDCEVIGINKLNSGYEITVKESGREVFRFVTEVVINCAGLNSDTIAQMAGIDIVKENYRLKYCKGQYFRVNNPKICSLIKSLVYPVPNEQTSCLGVHLTKDLNGSLRLGPDAIYVNRDNFTYEVDVSQKNKFLESALKFLPFLKEDDLIPDIAGIRPKLQAEGEDFRDFVIKEEATAGLEGFINLIGIESPGLTSDCSIADYVADILK